MKKRLLASVFMVCACGKPDALNQPIDATSPVADAGFTHVLDAGSVDAGPGRDAVIADVYATPDAVIRDAFRRDQQPEDVWIVDAGFEPGQPEAIGS